MSTDSPLPALVCFALPEEARPFQRLMRTREDVRTLITGVGRRNSELALRGALAKTLPVHILTCGYAGALDPELELGQVIFSCDSGWQPRNRLLAAGAREVRFHCADRIAASAEAKRALRAASGADAVEMESEVIRRLSLEQGIPSATIRVVSDAADEDLPLDFNRFMTEDQRLDLVKLGSTVVRSPGVVPSLLRLRRQTRFAADQLARVLLALLRV